MDDQSAFLFAVIVTGPEFVSRPSSVPSHHLRRLVLTGQKTFILSGYFQYPT